jgi:hypothetical protein
MNRAGVIGAYHQLSQIEESFRMANSDLPGRLTCETNAHEPWRTPPGQAFNPWLWPVPHDDQSERRTAHKYSNATNRERLRQDAAD